MFQALGSKYRKLDIHLQEMIRASLSALLLRGIGLGLALAFNITIGRLYGVEGAGLFFLALTIITISSIICQLGIDNSLLRFISAHAVHGEWGEVKGVYRLSLRLTLLSSGIITMLLLTSSRWLSETVFKMPELADMLLWMSISILPLTVINIQAQSLKGLKQIYGAMVIQSIGIPLVSLLLMFVLHNSGVIGAVWSYTVSTCVILYVGFLIWNHAMHEHVSVYPSFQTDKLLESIKPLFIVTLTGQAILPFSPIIILGILSTSDDIGIYGAANRLVMLISIMFVAVSNVLAPKFSELYSQEEFILLGRLVRQTLLTLLVLTSPLILIMIFWGSWLMSMFGQGFESGGNVIAILAIGGAINIILGAYSYLLIVSGNEKYFQYATVMSAVICVVATGILTPHYGATGAAVATVVAVAVLNIISVVFVHTKTKVDIFN